MRKLLGVLIFAASFGIAAFVVAEKHSIDSFLNGAGPAAIPISILIFALVASAPFSVTDALAVSNGVVFGPWVGSAINAAGLVIAAVLSYVIARRTSKLWQIDSELAKLPAWTRRFKVGSPAFLIFVRAIPGIGGTVATQTAAALHVPIARQIYTMCAVTVPWCTLLAFGGHTISSYVHQHIIVPAKDYEQRHHMGTSGRP
jgi:uncharacterized membrane protein YdjX (TVP38/TMEM64 family)